MERRAFRSALFAGVIALGGLSTAALAQPANDSCAAAQPVAAGSRTLGDSTGATSQIASATCAGDATDNLDVWFSFTPPATGDYAITTDLSTGLEDTTLAVYTACGGPEIACDDDGGFGLLSHLIVTLTGGVNYRIRVAGFDGTTGSFVLDVSNPIFSAGADLCAAATVVAAGNSYYGDNSTATSDIPESTCSFDDSQDVWFSFTPPATAFYRITTNGSPELDDTSLQVFSACGGVELFCSEDDGAGFLAELNPLLSGGVNYRIRVAGFGGATGRFLLTINNPVTPPPVPPNDACGGAIAITSLPFTHSVDIGGAGPDPDLASCNVAAATMVQSGVWYAYTPPTTRFIRIQERSLFNTFLTVLTGSCGGTLTEVPGTCGAQTLLQVTGGVTYRILVGGVGASPVPPGTIIDLHVEEVFPPTNDTCATARVVTGTLTEEVDTVLAMNENAEPSGSCNSIGAPGIDNSIWYTFVPTATGLLSGSADSDVALYDMVGVLYTGSCGSLTEVACYDLEPFDFTQPDAGSSVLTAGVRYYLAIGDWGTEDRGGDTQISITLPMGGSGMGACCSGATCVLTLPGACTGAHRLFAGVNTACNPPGNRTTPCCFADFNHVGGLTVQDIFDFLSAYFNQNPFADVNGLSGVTVQDIFDFLSAYFNGCS